MPARLAAVPARFAPVVLAVAAVAAGCSSAAPHAAPPVASTPVATATTTPTATSAATSAPPSAVYRPTNAQSTPDAAAAALVEDWAAGTRAAAATLAAPAAISALFAQAYKPGGLQARGCTDPSANPGTCTYADQSTGSLYQFAVTKIPAGWYVSSVTVES